MASGLFAFLNPGRLILKKPLFFNWILALVLLTKYQIAVAMGN
jgi:hypothetical protein